ncbi:MAG: hypothetical protein EHM12_03930, partial [Dehalococcoidia bacterium]
MANIRIVRVLISLLMCIAFLAIPSANVQAAAPPDPAWWARYGADTSGYGSDVRIAADSLGNVFVALYSYGINGSIIVKYGKDYVQGQAPAWVVTVADVYSNYTVNDITVDSTGVYVTGEGYDGSWNDVLHTLKYDLATGAMLWASPATCPGEGPAHIALDSTGVYVNGSVWRTSEDYVTVKYDKGTGAVCAGWPVYYDGVEDNDNDYAKDIAVYSGGVYVTGYSEKYYPDAPYHDNYFDIATVKYDSTSGAQLWAHRIFTWDSDDEDECYIAADSSGVYVAAASYLGDNRDTMTVKYPLNSATPLWGPVYYGGTYDDDVPAGIAVDSSGVYVTGNVEDSSGDGHYYTRKYGAADG